MHLKPERIIYTGLLFLLFPNFYLTQAQDSSLYLQMNFDKDKIIASVDSIKITAEEFFLSYQYGPAFVKKSSNPKRKQLEYMINEKLLALDGYSGKTDTSAEVSSLISDFRNDLATEELFKDSILSRVKLQNNEIDEAVKQKSINVNIQWLYSGDESVINNYYMALKNGEPFDSLFNSQLKDSVPLEDRKLETDLYKLQTRNPALAKIIDTLKTGNTSLPIHTEDGWYIVKIINIEQNPIATQSDYNKLKQEAVNSLTKDKMDALSDQYVRKMMIDNKPVIKREVFNFLRSYMGTYYLPPDKFKEWNLASALDENLQKTEDLNKLILINLADDNIFLNEFINWFRNRSEYIKLKQDNKTAFSSSLEMAVWRMVRDHLLSKKAVENNYYSNPRVVKQMSWWKDKIVGSVVRNQILKSIALENQEMSTSKAEGRLSEQIAAKFQEKLLHRILALKQKYEIQVNENVLNSIPVSDESEKSAAEFYFIKNGGLIPRTPYPTINNEWVNWE